MTGRAPAAPTRPSPATAARARRAGSPSRARTSAATASGLGATTLSASPRSRPCRRAKPAVYCGPPVGKATTGTPRPASCSFAVPAVPTATSAARATAPNAPRRRRARAPSPSARAVRSSSTRSVQPSGRVTASHLCGHATTPTVPGTRAAARSITGRLSRWSSREPGRRARTARPRVSAGRSRSGGGSTSRAKLPAQCAGTPRAR